MDIAKGICIKLRQILSKLKLLKIIRSFTYKVDFEKVDEDNRDCLMQIDDLLGKCIEKIYRKPRRAEIRNVIGELMRKKNIEQNLSNDSEGGDSTCIKKIKIKKEENSERRLESLKNCLLPCYKEKMYLCEFCGHRFVRSSCMRSHILRMHNKEETFTLVKRYESVPMTDKSESHLVVKLENRCNLCCELQDISQESRISGKRCPYHKASLPGALRDSVHRKRVEECGMIQNEERTSNKEKMELRKSYDCSECHKVFRLKRSLGKHIRLKHNHEIQINFPCSRCNKVFTEKGKLNRHLLIHKQGQFQCSQCSKSFHRMDNLRRHFSLIHQQLNVLECRYCQKRFSLKFNRDVHERNVHEMGAEIHCQLCGKKYKNKTTFNEHKKIHEKDPFSCTLCSKKFMRKIQYRSHLKNKHKGISPFQKLFDSVAKATSDSAFTMFDACVPENNKSETSENRGSELINF